MSYHHPTRVIENVLQTPIYQFEHPATGSSVDLVGMFHVGDPAYFEAATAYVNNREADGSAVHYEEMRLPTTEELADSGVDPGLFERFSAAKDDMTAVMVDILGGLVFQLDGMQYGSGWENHDIGRLDLVQRLGGEAVEEFVASVEKMKQLEATRPDMVRKMTCTALRHPAIRRRLANLSAQGRKEQRIAAERNQVALVAVDDVLDQDPSSDLTLIWGGEHLQGLGKGLRQRGYELRGTQWLDAFTLPA